MVSAPTLYGKKRKLSTKGYLKKMKLDGWVPGVIYNKEEKSQTVLLEARELKRIFSHTGTRGVFMLEIEGENNPIMVLIRELQKNPLSSEYTHIDFLPIKSNEKVHNTVNIHLIGEDELINQGKALQVITKELEIVCLPADIPDRLSFDVSNLNIGDKVVFADIKIPPSVELVQDPSTVVCSVMGQLRDPEFSPENVVAGDGELK
ncbi:MAG: 50S ribosomal protein L25 [Syntrophomonas sp.]